MQFNTLIFALGLVTLSLGAEAKAHKPHKAAAHKSASKTSHKKHHKGDDREARATPETKFINTGELHPDSLIDFAKTNIGTPYLYASTNPDKGFDCSGFVSYCFNHFGITVPRGSADYAGVQHRVALEDARPGDIILFTGTKTHHRHSIGHMGIIVKGFNDVLEFIHSSSGDAHGVTISQLNPRYLARLVKIVRIFPEAITPAPVAAIEE